VQPITLAYHGFGRTSREADPHHLLVLEDQFRAQLALLGRRNLRAVDLDGFLEAARSGSDRRAYLITMDDGYVSVLEIAAPILARSGHPALLFVSPELLGRDTTPQRILSVDELRQLIELGFEIGSHGLDHRPLIGLSDEELRRQCEESRQPLSNLLGTPPRAFSYPHGAFDERATRAVAAAGYEIAFAVERSAGRFAVPRLGVYGRDSIWIFRAKLLLERHRLGGLRRAAGKLRGEGHAS
jgi:peptidoglycan/xylan/chitin deacetylase (PgdA/CDA1 family)